MLFSYTRTILFHLVLHFLVLWLSSPQCQRDHDAHRSLHNDCTLPRHRLSSRTPVASHAPGIEAYGHKGHGHDAWFQPCDRSVADVRRLDWRELSCVGCFTCSHCTVRCCNKCSMKWSSCWTTRKCPYIVTSHSTHRVPPVSLWLFKVRFFGVWFGLSKLKLEHRSSGRLTSGSWPGQAVPSPFCQRSKDEGKLRPKFTKSDSDSDSDSFI